MRRPLLATLTSMVALLGACAVASPAPAELDGLLPTPLLQSIGIRFETKFGKA